MTTTSRCDGSGARIVQEAQEGLWQSHFCWLPTLVRAGYSATDARATSLGNEG